MITENKAPTFEELINIEAGRDKIEDYSAKRRNEYPSFEQYLDGVVKGDQAQIQAYIDACLAVKAKYPKPEEGNK